MEKRKFELIIEDENVDGVFAISLVDVPAIKANFVAFNEHNEHRFKTANNEKRLVTGALLIPEMLIHRNADKNHAEPYDVYLSAETIERASQLYLKNNFANKSTVQHELPVQDVTLVESWIVSDSKVDKSRTFGMDLPVGTWVGTMKIENDELWNDFIKTGELKGFSIEALFGEREQKFNEEAFLAEVLEELSRQK